MAQIYQFPAAQQAANRLFKTHDWQLDAYLRRNIRADVTWLDKLLVALLRRRLKAESHPMSSRTDEEILIWLEDVETIKPFEFNKRAAQ